MENASNKRNPYRVPENYLEDFSAKMRQRISEITPEPAPEPVKPAKSVWLYLKPVLSVAAMISVIYVCTYFVVQPRLERQNAEALAAAEAQEQREADLLAASLSDEDYDGMIDEISLDDLYFDEYLDDMDL